MQKWSAMSTSQNELKQWIVDLRNDFHKHPELSTLEKRTTRKICEKLKTLNAEIRTFDDLTGVVGLFRGEKQSSQQNRNIELQQNRNIELQQNRNIELQKNRNIDIQKNRNINIQKGGNIESQKNENNRTIALRADIDALPMQDSGNKIYKSINDGVMHSCGHDANTAIALGVAKKIRDSGLLNRIDGTIKFIFQPAEEKLGGARAMIERGVLENPGVDQIIAGHMDPNLPVGTAGVFSHIGHASSDTFELVIKGKGSHGAHPHKGISPITAGGLFVTSLESIIPRHISRV